MVVELSVWLQLILWGNLLMLVTLLAVVAGMHRERKKLERVIISAVKNRKNYR